MTGIPAHKLAPHRPAFHPEVRARAVAVLVASAVTFAAFSAFAFWVRSPASIVSWVIVFTALSLSVLGDPRTRIMAQVAFLAATWAGLVILRDNWSNFGVLFSGGHDDSEFFYNIIQWISGEDFVFESPLFQGLNGVYALLLSFLTSREPQELTLLDLLPLNWATAGVAVVIADRLVRRVVGRPAPMWIILLPLIGNHNFIANVARFYRDGYIAVLSALALYFVLHRAFGRGLLSVLALGMMRVGNGALMLFFLAVAAAGKRMPRWLTMRGAFAIAIVMMAALSLGALRESGGIVFAAASKVTAVERRVQAFQGMSYQELVARRLLTKALRGGNETRAAALEEGGVVGFGYKLVYSTFFPIAMHGPRTSQDFNSLYSGQAFKEAGLFYWNVVRWIFPLIWIFVAPYWLMGIWHGWHRDERTAIVVSLYAITVLAVSQVSFQLRHTTAFVVLHPVLVALGAEAIRSYPKGRRWARRIAVGMAAFVLAYNVYEWM